MIGRFTHLLKSFSLARKKERLLQEMSKAQVTPSAYDNGSAGLKLSEGNRKGEIIAHRRKHNNSL